MSKFGPMLPNGRNACGWKPKQPEISPEVKREILQKKLDRFAIRYQQDKPISFKFAKSR